MTVRQDAWSDNDDRLLANTVIKHIREGSTQLKAFDETGDLLDRTSAACGFRWNALVRQKYTEEIKNAKRERKQRMRLSAKQAASQISSTPQPTDMTIDYLIQYLESLASDLQQGSPEEITQEIGELHEENTLLEKEIHRVKEEHAVMKRDYETIVKLMNRARELAMTEEQAYIPQTFRMDVNGNLEKYSS
ncbi:RsfA family transcriptional regulator [Bacillus piscicola]|uniref:RsfA family transcriptional regulator n=1 Tax=Bacillus piscicola TaxID=1632684 RepID=UPI001F09B88A|nr:RsfA family transcriptional regulator [Bacillus piscicola]